MKHQLIHFLTLFVGSCCLFVACEEEAPEVIVDFAANETSVQEGSRVTFTDQSSGEPNAWAWTFEGGTPGSSDSQNPTVTYNIAGTYKVTLTAKNDDNNNTKTVDDFITVYKAVEAEFMANDTVIPEGESIPFTDQSSGEPTEWAWIFEGGNPATSTNQHPTITYATPGTYSVTLTVTNANTNDTKSRIGYIRVFALVEAGFTADTTEITQGESIQFTDQSAGGPTEWAWTFEGGTPSNSDEQNPTITYDTPGTYEVTLVASNADTSSTTTKTGYITVNSLINLEKGLVAYYPFNGNANDESGNGNHGTLVGGTSLTTDRFGNVNAAFNFDGVDDLIMLPDTLLNNEIVSFNVWVKTDDQTFSIISGANKVDDNEFLIYAHEDGGHDSYIELFFHEDASLGLNGHQLTNALINDDKWYMLSLVVTKEMSYVYVDGKLIDTLTYASSYAFDIEGLWLGGDQDVVDGGWQTPQQFGGIMDDIRIYNRVINEAEIEALFNEEN